MFESLLSLLDKYKKGTFYKPPPGLGDRRNEITEKTNGEIFICRLKSSRTSRYRLVITIIVTLILIIMFLGWLIWKHNDNQTYVLTLLGGQGASVFLAVNLMLRLKREELFSAIIIDLLPKANTKEEREKIIDTVIEYLKG